MSGVTFGITNDIKSDKLEARLNRRVTYVTTKRAPEEKGMKVEAMKLIREQENELQEKIGSLNVEFRDSAFLERRSEEILDKAQFDIENIKTKKAE